MIRAILYKMKIDLVILELSNSIRFPRVFIIVIVTKTNVNEFELYLESLSLALPSKRPGNVLIEHLKIELFSAPIYFIGGVHRSGSKLLKHVLNQHPDVNCSSPSVVFSGLLWQYFNQDIA